jgi:hypothetical protein
MRRFPEGILTHQLLTRRVIALAKSHLMPYTSQMAKVTKLSSLKLSQEPDFSTDDLRSQPRRELVKSGSIQVDFLEVFLAEVYPSKNGTVEVSAAEDCAFE